MKDNRVFEGQVASNKRAFNPMLIFEYGVKSGGKRQAQERSMGHVPQYLVYRAFYSFQGFLFHGQIVAQPTQKMN
ncbi:MAG: hypothetical protein IPI58_00620 [Alphaproteobacteria bacterium]|nr:MAG: hypothetical protein IPI58_00620 [Alphaproteobacteria bacterium]